MRRRIGRGLGLVLLLAYFGFAVLAMAMRYVVMPRIESLRPQLETAISKSIGLPVRVGALSASWQGLRPEFHLRDLRIEDATGAPVLTLPVVHAVLSWRSVVLRAPHVHRLSIDAAALTVSRDADGTFRVAGLPILAAQTTDSTLANWVLEQPELMLEQATLTWIDHQRAAPPLILDQVRLRITNAGHRHRFGLSARLSRDDQALVPAIDLRGDLRGDSFTRLDDWRGEIFVEASAVPLGGFAPWFDYPLTLPRGEGGVRAWLTLAEGELRGLTADLALRAVQATLAPHLPELSLSRLTGRLSATRDVTGYHLASRDLRVALADGTELPTLDAQGNWQVAAERVTGEARFNAIDLAALAHLSDTLPLDDHGRALLKRFAPRGRLLDVSARFAGSQEKLDAYSLSGRFVELGLAADGTMPGFEGFSGELHATQDGGALLLRSGPSAVSLPAVFPESRIAFDALAADIKWTRPSADALAVHLAQVSFSGPDAVGAAEGHYRYDGEGPGTIDLTARIGEADGRAVWRYMPRVVGDSTRQWLRASILAGTARNAALTLKGDLRHFPFRDGRNGTFRVTADMHDAVLDYASGWPKIEGIAGDLRFEGVTMEIRARQGRIAGTDIAQAVAAIRDLELSEEILTVDGQVRGPTQRFLDFIEASPVGASIEHATAAMQAQGRGELRLDLVLPLRQLDASQISGEYRMADNTLNFVPGLPPLEKLGGRVAFTGSEVSIPAATASFLGQPARIVGQPRDGLLAIQASGTLTAAAARRFYAWPVFDHLSGTAPFTADIRVRKTTADVVVESSLEGVSSSLPLPFNKGATEKWPLRVERRVLAASKTTAEQELWRVRLASIATAEAVRVSGGTLSRLTLAIGEPLPRTPPPGWAAALTLPELDVGFWRGLLPASDIAVPTPSILPALTLRTPRLIVGGRTWHEVSLRAQPVGSGYDGRVTAKEVSGDWIWRGPLPGRLQARLKELALAAEETDAAALTEPAADPRDWPVIDLVADQFAFGARRFGRLELRAAGEGRDNAGGWRINRLALISPDGVIEADGLWQIRPAVSTAVNLSLTASNAGALLGRLGHPDALRGGKASLTGTLAWSGAPHQLDYGTLSGQLGLNVQGGQFQKLKPGVGKLIGLLSLQNLPRRLFLDFSDVISEGFAFDLLTTDMTLNKGIAHTDELSVRGPSAQIVMRGDVDLARETQDLRVSVQPQLGSTASLGVAVVNPVAGVAALLAQKLLGNPLDKVFAFDYHVTGTWTDPQVNPVARPAVQGGVVP